MTRAQRYAIPIAFILLAATLIALRVQVVMALNERVIDADQPIMWLGARHYAAGKFYEPRYYGQDYNTFMEALVAAPLLYMRTPVLVAVPIATQLIFLFPFLVPAVWLFRQKRQMAAMVFILIPLCMPSGYDVLNGISRGFVTGLFFCSFNIVSLLRPFDRRWLYINVALNTIGFFVNPNSLLVSAPMLLYVLSLNLQKRLLLQLAGFVALLCGALFALFDLFYLRHPKYVLLGIQKGFSWSSFRDNISHLDDRFAQVSPFFEGHCWLLLVLLAVLVWRLALHNRRALAAFSFLLVLVLVSFSFNKTTEGANWAFYPYSRMYLGIPLAAALFTSLLPMRAQPAALVALLFGVWKLFTFPAYVEKETQPEKFRFIMLYKMSDALNAIGHYRAVCEHHRCNFLLTSTGFWLHSVITYGGPAVDPSYPETQETDTDRRYWVRERNDRRIPPRFLFISSVADFNVRAQSTEFKMERLDDYGAFLVTENRMTIGDFMKLAIATESGAS